MFTFHLEAAQPDTGKLSSVKADPLVLEVRANAMLPLAWAHIIEDEAGHAQLWLPVHDNGMREVARPNLQGVLLSHCVRRYAKPFVQLACSVALPSSPPQRLSWCSRTLTPAW
jgi:hypothetical protein